MVGSAIRRKLEAVGYANIIGSGSKDLDLRSQKNVQLFFEKEKPDFVFMAAAKVGGILANDTFKADFLYDNLMVQTNIIHSSYVTGVKKLLFLGSSCIYPKFAPQPLKEEYLLSGTLEPTNEPYAIAKIAGIKLCEAYRAQYGCNFISAMPTNLYGPNDHYDLAISHVLPALIKKIHSAKINNDSEVEVWGTGKPLREFLHVDDLADALVFLMQEYNESQFINVGSGSEISIEELTHMIKEIVGYHGQFTFDLSKPDGTPRKLMDSSRIFSLGWSPKIDLKQGIAEVYQKYISLVFSQPKI